MASWQFTYNQGVLSIALPVTIEGMETFDMPLSKLYDVIDSARLNPGDLEAYEAYQTQRHAKMVALTFDDGPDPTTTPQALISLTSTMLKQLSLCLGRMSQPILKWLNGSVRKDMKSGSILGTILS